MNWPPIETAPKDGTNVIIYNDDWDCAPVACWAEYPGNPVLDSQENEEYIWGWLFDESICLGEEEGFLGWDSDPMPTHWMPLPDPSENKKK